MLKNLKKSDSVQQNFVLKDVQDFTLHQYIKKCVFMALNLLKRNITILKISANIDCTIIQYMRLWTGLRVSDIALSKIFFTSICKNKFSLYNSIEISCKGCHLIENLREDIIQHNLKQFCCSKYKKKMKKIQKHKR